MEHLLFSVNIVLPLFLLLAIGYFLRMIKIIDDVFVDKVSSFVYKFAMPVMLFYNIYTSDVRASFSPRIIVYAVAVTLVTVLLLCLIVPRFVKGNKTGVLIQAIFRSNFLLFATHIMASIYGNESLGETLVLVAVLAVVYNVCAVIVLAVYSDQTHALDKKKAMIDIAKNPLILGSVLGVVFALIGADLGTVVNGVLDDISSLSTPLALIVLGGQFKFANAKKNGRYIAAAAFGKLIAAPVFVIGVAILLGFRGSDLGLMLAMSASPTAVNSYIMAQQAGGDGKLAGEAVVFTSALSVVTIFLFVFALRSLGLL